MVADVSSEASPAYLVVNRYCVVAADIAETIIELDPNAKVICATTLPEAADRLPGLDRIVLAVIEGAPTSFGETPFGQALAERGVRVLLLDGDVEQAEGWPKLAILGLPFTAGALRTALRLAIS